MSHTCVSVFFFAPFLTAAVCVARWERKAIIKLTTAAIEEAMQTAKDFQAGTLAANKIVGAIDTNGDGRTDRIEIDVDGDGIVDVVGIDTTGDGVIDSFDVDGDGEVDIVTSA